MLSCLEDWLRRRLKLHCLALASLQRTIARSRSRLTWLQEGDTNTSFFHLHARFRNRKNYVARLKVDDLVLTSHDDMQKIVWEYFHKLIGTPHQRSFTLNLPVILPSAADLDVLELPFTEWEVWHTIRQIPSDKAPGPDGFTSRFYKECRTVIKEDIMVALHAVHGGIAGTFTFSIQPSRF